MNDSLHDALCAAPAQPDYMAQLRYTLNNCFGTNWVDAAFPSSLNVSGTLGQVVITLGLLYGAHSCETLLTPEQVREFRRIQSDLYQAWVAREQQAFNSDLARSIQNQGAAF